MKCIFCGRNSNEYEKIISDAGKDYGICNICIDEAHKIVHTQSSEIEDDKILITPKSIKDDLDKYVIGQEEPKKVLSVAVYNHLIKIDRNLTNVQKGNVLLIGPTGCGKTLLAQTLAKTLKVPFVVTDATTLTEAGYVGEDVESILQPLLMRCNYNTELASRGIVYIDEIDKKARKTGGNPSITRDVSGEGVQYGLLKMIEGTIANVHAVGTRKHPQSNCTQLDTTNILFILGGAFFGLSEIISDRLGKNEVGFKTSNSFSESDLLKQIEQDDLIQYGLIPELVGRMPIVSILDKLQVSDLVRILTEPKDNLIDQYKTLLKEDKIQLSFSEKTIQQIAQTAYNKKIGARGLKSVIEKMMLDFMYDVDRDKEEEQNIEF